MAAPSPRPRALLPLLSIQCLCVLLGCASVGSGDLPDSQPVSLTSPQTEMHALLLLLADRRLYEPIVVREALSGDEDLRRHLGLTLARLADPRGLDALLELLEDRSPDVRRAAAFGLGRLGNERARAPLLLAVADPDRRVGQQAVAAAAALGVPLRAVTDALAAVGEEELGPRLLPHLYRFAVAERQAVERLGLASNDAELRAWAAYSLVLARRPGSLDRLRAWLTDEDPRVRTWSALALGDSGGRGDLGRLLPVLADGEARVVAAAIEAGRRLVSRGVVSPSEEWRNRLVELARDPRRPVRVAALAAASAWLLDEDLAAILVRHATSDGPAGERERERALLALARGGDPRAEELLVLASTAPSARIRLAAARGAGALGNRALLERLRDDPDAEVRGAVLEQELALLARSSSSLEELHELLRWGLSSASPAVRRAALEFLVATPLLGPADLAAAGADESVRFARVRLETVRALESRAARVPEDGTAVEAELRILAEDRLYVVRREAVRALEARGVEAPPVGPVQTGRSVAVYEEILAQARRDDVSVRIETEIGGITVRLSCPDVPLSCVSFRQLASQGFYDGLPFFAAVPWGLAMTGRDAGGGPGFFVRDEMTPRSFDRAGLVGLVSEVPDGNAGELFFTLSPLPSLDGEATFLGTVADGLDVLGELVEGDRILSVREILP